MKFILNEEETLEEAGNRANARNGIKRARAAERQQQSVNNNTQDTQQQTTQDTDDNNSEEIEANTDALDDATGKRLLKIIKAASKDGYERFRTGIKGNLNDPGYPFVKLMNNPKFSAALGVGTISGKFGEELNEADSTTALDAGERISGAINDVTNDVKNALGKTKLGRAVTNIKGRVDPKTFSKFGTVYNAFIANNVDGKYVDDAKSVFNDDAIVYDQSLYRLKNLDDIKRAIQIDYDAFKKSDKDKHDELKRAVSQGRVSYTGNSTSNRVDNLAKEIRSLSDEEKNALKGALNGS